MECDREISAKVKKHLSMYKIRRKVKIQLVEDEIGHIIGCDEKITENGLNGIFYDPRVKDLGKRSFGNKNNFKLGELSEYHQKRYELGIPEGSSEILFDKSFPLENNLEKMGGVSFHKGTRK